MNKTLSLGEYWEVFELSGITLNFGKVSKMHKEYIENKEFADTVKILKSIREEGE